MFLARAYWFSSCAFLRGQPATIAQLPRDEPGYHSTPWGYSGAERIRDAAVQESVAQLADPVIGKVFVAEVAQCVGDGLDRFGGQAPWLFGFVPHPLPSTPRCP